jgi:Domain of unknown function (DUF4342)
MSTTPNETPVGDTTQSQSETGTPPKSERTWTEQIEVAGNELVERVKKLIAEGNVRKVIIRNEKGDSLLEIPMTAGVVVGGVFAMAFPVLAALGAFAALLANVKVEVVRSSNVDKP